MRNVGKRGLKVNTNKSKVVIFGGKEGLECGIRVDGEQLEQASELKYFECVLDESGMDVTECHRKVASERKLHMPSGHWLMIGVCRLSVLGSFEGLLVPILPYGSETMIMERKLEV